jgi:nitroreductase
MFAVGIKYRNFISFIFEVKLTIPIHNKMDVFEALLNRRSIRKYTGEKVSDELLEKIIEAGMYAPSAVNTKPWHYIVFRSASTFDAIIEANSNAGMLKQASAAILICYDEKLQHDNGYGPVDCSAATQNMLLAAHGLGLGACWVGIYPRQNRIDALHNLFNLPEHVVPFAVISIGFPNEARNKPLRFLKDRIHWEKW